MKSGSLSIPAREPSEKRYLAWDTSSLTGVIAAFEVIDGKKKLVAEWSLSLETAKHSERLLWTIDLVLQSAGWKVQSLNGIVVGVGPGSFTGLRIGLTTARMLAMQLKIPVIPISSLALLARPVADMVYESLSFMSKVEQKIASKTLLIACTDATKGEWFTILGSAKAIRDCVIQPEGDHGGIWSRGIKERALTPDEVFAEARAYLKKNGPTTKWIAVGQSVERYDNLFKTLPGKSRIQLTRPFLHQPQARALVQLGWEAIQQGIERDSLHIFPRYLRDSDAEVKLKKGLLKQQPVVTSKMGIA